MFHNLDDLDLETFLLSFLDFTNTGGILWPPVIHNHKTLCGLDI